CLRDVHPKVGSSSLVSSTLCSLRTNVLKPGSTRPVLAEKTASTTTITPPDHRHSNHHRSNHNYIVIAMATSGTFLMIYQLWLDLKWAIDRWALRLVLHELSKLVYDMRFELNEVKARSEHYPSTISFLNLLNSLIAEERDATDRGRRFICIFRFIYDHVVGPFSQSAYADPSEK
ncbi:nuclear pore complex protein NUP205, partial [Tanacetum coccineum]